MQPRFKSIYTVCKEAKIARIFAFLGVFLLCLFAVRVTDADERFSRERFLADKDAPWEITANSLSYDEKEETYMAKGDVVIKRADQAL